MTASSASPDFNFIAPVYDRLAKAVFGKAQVRAQGHYLNQIPAVSSVLVIGGGSGEILVQLMQSCVPAKVLYLEASSVMLQKAKHRMNFLPHLFPVEFRLGTENDLLPHEKFDVVLTPFVLDLFDNSSLTLLMQKLDAALAADGLWLNTDFHLSSGRLQQAWQKSLLWAMYQFFGAMSQVQARQLPDFDSFFRQAGYSTLDSAFFCKGFIKTQLLQKPPSP